MFATVDGFLATADLALAFGDFELAVEDVLRANACLVPPSRRSERLLLDDFLDDSLNGKRGLGDLLKDSGAWSTSDGSLSGRDNTAGSTGEEFGLTTSNLGLADSDIALASEQCLSALGGDDSPEALVLDICTIRPAGGGGCGAKLTIWPPGRGGGGWGICGPASGWTAYGGGGWGGPASTKRASTGSVLICGPGGGAGGVG